MACIIKIPTASTKGVVTFTTQERDKFILSNKELYNKVEKLKDKWVIGLHHNWHDFNFSYNPLFDFSMAGESDLTEKDGKDVPLFSRDACNFSPSVFHFSSNEKFWDILYVARAVYFKKIPEFFRIIRALYDAGFKYRVLLISPIPDDCKTDPKSSTVFCGIRKMYNEMFSQQEQDLFTLLTTDYRNPFPFDIPTIAHFYKHSKVFVHTADDERRCRVSGYAWACGMPVVCLDFVASLLPKEKQHKPLVYKAKSYEDFPDLIREAVSFVESMDYNIEAMSPAISETSEKFTTVYLKTELAKYYSITGSIDDDQYFNLFNLDIRLGRHHGLGSNTNSVGWSLNSLVNYMAGQPFEKMREDILHTDFERYITQYKEFGEIEVDTLYKQPVIERVKVYIYNHMPFAKTIYKRIKNKG